MRTVDPMRTLDRCCSPKMRRHPERSRFSGGAKDLASVAVLLASIVVSAATAAPPSPQELLTTGRVDDAIQTLQQQIARSAQDAAAYNLLCRAHFMLEEWDRGIPACERAVTLDPK